MRPGQIAEEIAELIFTELTNWKEFETIFDALESDEQETIEDTVKQIIEDVLISHEELDNTEED